LRDCELLLSLRLSLYEDPRGPRAIGHGVGETDQSRLLTTRRDRKPGDEIPGLFCCEVLWGGPARPKRPGTGGPADLENRMPTITLPLDMDVAVAPPRLDHLRALEAESIQILREVVAE